MGWVISERGEVPGVTTKVMGVWTVLGDEVSEIGMDSDVSGVVCALLICDVGVS